MSWATGADSTVPRRFTAEQVQQIRREFEQGRWRTQLDAANHYDISQSRISELLTRTTYAWVPEG